MNFKVSTVVFEKPFPRIMPKIRWFSTVVKILPNESFLMVPESYQGAVNVSAHEAKSFITYSEAFEDVYE